MMRSPLRSFVLGLTCLAFLSCIEPVDKGGPDTGAAGSGGRGGSGGSGGGGSGGSGGSGGGGDKKDAAVKAPDAPVKKDTAAKGPDAASKADAGSKDAPPRDSGGGKMDAAAPPKMDGGGGAAKGYNLPPDLAAQFRGHCAGDEPCAPVTDLIKNTAKHAGARRPAP